MQKIGLSKNLVLVCFGLGSFSGIYISQILIKPIPLCFSLIFFVSLLVFVFWLCFTSVSLLVLLNLSS